MFKKRQDYFKQNLKWEKSKDPEYPYQAIYNGHYYKIRLNDFPEENLYSLIINNNFVCDFNDWPENWKR